MKEILIIDDDDAIRATIVLHLARLEVGTVDVSDAREAIDLLAVRKFDLIISDLFMPEVDGIKFISIVRRTNPSIPIILISGGGEIFPLGSRNFGSLTRTASMLGASHILQKPFRGQELRDLVLSLLDRDSSDETDASAP